MMEIEDEQPNDDSAGVSIDQIQALLDRRPFRPFRIELGKWQLVIGHPHALARDDRDHRSLECCPRGQRPWSFQLAMISALVELEPGETG